MPSRCQDERARGDAGAGTGRCPAEFHRRDGRSVLAGRQRARVRASADPREVGRLLACADPCVVSCVRACELVCVRAHTRRIAGLALARYHLRARDLPRHVRVDPRACTRACVRAMLGYEHRRCRMLGRYQRLKTQDGHSRYVEYRNRRAE